MLDQQSRQTVLDEEHLKLLSIGYYISAGFSAAFSFFGLLYMAMGIFFLVISRSHSILDNTGQPPPQLIGSIFTVIGLAIFIFLMTLSILKFISGNHIKKRRSRIFSMVVAGINCLEFPYGTLLSIFTFLVLSRNSVKKLYSEPGADPAGLGFSSL
jgi:hypothetical protein